MIYDLFKTMEDNLYAISEYILHNTAYNYAVWKMYYVNICTA